MGNLLVSFVKEKVMALTLGYEIAAHKFHDVTN